MKSFVETRPYVQDPDMPGPGVYDLKSFVQNNSNNPKPFTIGSKNRTEMRKQQVTKS